MKELLYFWLSGFKCRIYVIECDQYKTLAVFALSVLKAAKHLDTTHTYFLFACVLFINDILHFYINPNKIKGERTDLCWEPFLLVGHAIHVSVYIHIYILDLFCMNHIHWTSSSDLYFSCLYLVYLIFLSPKHIIKFLS